LPTTLEYLAKQVFENKVNWEVILVDNVSSDNTAAAALEIWAGIKTDIPLRIVSETVPGLVNARKRGIQSAVFSILVFCDDDNWLATDYLQTAFRIMENHPGLAACGGNGTPVFESSPPQWFENYAEAFALGSQEKNKEGHRQISLYGAGLVLRKKALETLFSLPFEPLLSDRVGSKLSSAGDTELTNAMVISGFEIRYFEELHFKHFITTERLGIKYLERLFRSFGSDGPVRNLYYSYLTTRFAHKLISVWIFHLCLAGVRLFKYIIKPPKPEGRRIYLLWNIAYIKTLIRIAPRYQKMKNKISRLQYKAQSIDPGLLNSDRRIVFDSSLKTIS
jgi:glycosyltransferase involved in cell wall biosynthesis